MRQLLCLTTLDRGEICFHPQRIDCVFAALDADDAPTGHTVVQTVHRQYIVMEGVDEVMKRWHLLLDEPYRHQELLMQEHRSQSKAVIEEGVREGMLDRMQEDLMQERKEAGG